MSADRARYSYISDIDGLRGLAVMAVLGYHFFPNAVWGGFLGVDVFFVISGFVISRILLAEVQEDRFSLSAFFRRRAIRLLPALLTILYACALAGAVLFFSDEFSGFSRHIGAGLAFVSNFLLWYESGYFDHDAVTKPLLHLWSLGVEAQFYLIWPFVIARFGRDARRFPLILAAITIGSFFVSLFIYSRFPELEFYGPLSRIWEFALGCAVAYIWRSAPDTDSVVLTMKHGTEYLWLLAMFALLSSLIVLSNSDGVKPAVRVIPVVATAIILWLSGKSVLSRTCLSNPVSRWLGHVSYPLYLWHWPLLSFYLIISPGQRPTTTASMTLGLVAITLAWLTYRYIERPYQLWTRSLSGRVSGMRLATTLASMLFVFVLLSLADDGWKGRGTSYVREVQQLDWPYFATTGCKARFRTPPTYCLFKPGTKPYGVAILGDSVSNALYPGISLAAQPYGIRVWQIGKPGCPPLVGVEKLVASSATGCDVTTSKVLDFVLSERTISTVVISSAFATYVTGHVYTADLNQPTIMKLVFPNADGNRPGLSNREVYKLGLTKTFEKLLGAGKRVIFVHQVPELGFNPKVRCLSRRPVALFPALSLPCAVAREAVERHQAGYRTVLDTVLQQFPEVEVVDPNELLCDTKWCYGMRSDKLLYRDNVHLSISGSELLSSVFSELLGPTGLRNASPRDTKKQASYNE